MEMTPAIMRTISKVWMIKNVLKVLGGIEDNVRLFVKYFILILGQPYFVLLFIVSYLILLNYTYMFSKCSSKY